MTKSKLTTVPALAERVLDVIESRRLLKKGATVVVGVSGGPDSVGLLHILWQLRYQLGITIVAGHFNHRLRRQESLADERFVVQQAKKLNISVVCERSKSSRTRQGSVEDSARRERFEFLIRLATRYQAQAVVLAHTQDDLAETVLMRVLRGAGLLGLRGILMERAMSGMNIIRPLLQVSKRDVLVYLKAEKLSFRVDQTNLKTDFYRNKVRLNLLPLLEKSYNPNIRQVLANLSDSVSLDYDFINKAATDLYNRIAKVDRQSVRIRGSELRAVHPALRRMLLRLAIEHSKGDLKRLTLEHILDLEDLLENRPVGSIVDLPGLRVIKSNTFLEFK